MARPKGLQVLVVLFGELKGLNLEIFEFKSQVIHLVAPFSPSAANARPHNTQGELTWYLTSRQTLAHFR